MTIPQKLATSLKAASILITQDGELPAGSRKDILLLIEELSSVEHVDAGYLRRARLALICAREVLGHIKPYEDVHVDALAILERGTAALSGKYALEKLKKENGELHTKVIDLFEHGEVAFVAAYSGMATFAAINTILYDTNFDLVGGDEKGVPPDDWDASYYGSLAVSGSAVWEGKGGIESRADYWRWYLEGAIPQAWDVVSPLKIN
ncbi:Imm5 family immunity protein [Ralstonia solanacearum]|uniref:Imm5 family immunity protein n=1 Tax=Ralstonia solanacearum TaxID=305 RepID=UPI0018D1D4DF|nr:Imm5 family immunity protein [Ralstonia solanacearum]